MNGPWFAFFPRCYAEALGCQTWRSVHQQTRIYLMLSWNNGLDNCQIAKHPKMDDRNPVKNNNLFISQACANWSSLQMLLYILFIFSKSSSNRAVHSNILANHPPDPSSDQNDWVLDEHHRFHEKTQHQCTFPLSTTFIYQNLRILRKTFIFWKPPGVSTG